MGCIPYFLFFGVDQVFFVCNCKD